MSFIIENYVFEITKILHSDEKVVYINIKYSNISYKITFNY